MFDRLNSLCYIKNATAGLNWVPSSHFDVINLAYTAQATEPPISMCPFAERLYYSSNGVKYSICPGSDYQVVTLQQLYGYKSDEACADQCTATKGCLNADFDSANSICYIKGPASGLAWVVNPDLDTLTVIGATQTGTRVVGSSGVAAQMVFLSPNTTKAIFIDNYHENTGGPGYVAATDTYGSQWLYPGTTVGVFGTEYDWQTTNIRTLHLASNTFCSAGSFWPDGTLMNMAGAEPAPGVNSGFQSIRTYAPGSCPLTGCTQDWVENSQLQASRWYPTAQTLTDGGVLVVGGANAGGLVTNLAEINVPAYEKHYQNGTSTNLVSLPILNFTMSQSEDPRVAYNLYPTLQLLPNSKSQNIIFQVAATRAEIWNYDTNKRYKSLPNTPNNQPRTFPATAMFALLPIRLNDQVGEILMCGGASASIPSPMTLNDCWRIRPTDHRASWIQDDDLPLGPQVMSDGILLPDGNILILNGARKGCGGGFMADDPVLTPLLYNPTASQGSRFLQLPGTNIPRLYHSVALLLPTGEVLIAGSNPAVIYDPFGNPPADSHFYNYNGESYLIQQQNQSSAYPTEYRVEYYSPPYMTSPSRPLFQLVNNRANPKGTFTVVLDFNGLNPNGPLVAMLSNPGFATHGVKMGQRMVELKVVNSNNRLTITAPPNHSYAPPGYHLLFVSVGGIPSQGQWVQIL